MAGGAEFLEKREGGSRSRGEKGKGLDGERILHSFPQRQVYKGKAVEVLQGEKRARLRKKKTEDKASNYSRKDPEKKERKEGNSKLREGNSLRRKMSE